MQASALDPANHYDGVRTFVDYFQLSVPRTNLDSLRAILAAFSQIPYENISKIIKWNGSWKNETPRIRLPEEVIQSHAGDRLGGTCFSLTFFLQSILTRHRFDCYPVMADMRVGRNIHCCLIVILKGTKYLVDPGYLLTQPMAIDATKPKLFRNQVSGVELRYDTNESHYDLFTFDKAQIKWRYRFKDRPVSAAEFQRHWLASFACNSMHGICLTKVMKDGMVYVHKNFMRETTFEGKRNFNIRKNYHASIREAFGIDTEVIEQARLALQENMQRERDVGLWVPKRSSRATLETHEAY